MIRDPRPALDWQAETARLWARAWAALPARHGEDASSTCAITSWDLFLLCHTPQWPPEKAHLQVPRPSSACPPPTAPTFPSPDTIRSAYAHLCTRCSS